MAVALFGGLQMKKRFLFLIFAVVAVIFAGCASKEVAEPPRRKLTYWERAFAKMSEAEL